MDKTFANMKSCGRKGALKAIIYSLIWPSTLHQHQYHGVIRGAIKWKRWILLAESKNYDPSPCLASGSFAETKVSFNPRLVHNEHTKHKTVVRTCEFCGKKSAFQSKSCAPRERRTRQPRSLDHRAARIQDPWPKDSFTWIQGETSRQHVLNVSS